MSKATSREVLMIEKNGMNDGEISFGSHGGCFVKKSTLGMLFCLFICALVVTGVLVYYYAPKVQGQTVETPESGFPKSGEESDEKDKAELKGEKKLENARLPRHLIPYKYEVKLKPLFDKDYNIDGEVVIYMMCRETANNVTVHINEIEVHGHPHIMDNNNQQLQVKDTEEDKERQFFIVNLEDSVQENRNYTIHMKFTAVLNDELVGFYRSKYNTTDGEQKVMGATQFQVPDARRAFPCFDEPEYKAKFKISLGRMKHMTSLSNMEIEKTEPEEGNDKWVWDHYGESVNMSTYLVAFIVSELKEQEYPSNAKWKCSIHARPEAIEKKQADYAGDIMPKILHFFEDFYDVPYPLPKLDMAAVPDFMFGGMENWGLIIYREAGLLFDPNVSSGSNKQRVSTLVAHEIAHMWFGDLVTPVWWTDLWLNEGFASYMESVGVGHVHPTWKMDENMVSGKMHSAMRLDSMESSHEISIPVDHPDEINEIFDAISYRKGASVIRMMAFFLTKETFRKGVSNYLKRFSYLNAEQDDLWRFLTAQAREDRTLSKDLTVKDIMDTWTLQMGYPVVEVTRTDNGKSINVKQKRFLLVENPNSTDTHHYSWWVPISYTNSKDKDFSDENAKASRWIPKDKEEITIKDVAKSKDDWVIVNLQQAGFYRVNYDEYNWKLITMQLNTDFKQIPAIQRSQLIDDAFNLARGGHIPYSTALSLTEYLQKEDSYYPLKTAVNALMYIDSMFSRSAGYKHFKKFMGNVVDKLYEKLDTEALKTIDTSYENLTDMQKNIRIMREACYFGNKQCIKSVQKMFKDFRDSYNESFPDNPVAQIPPDLKWVVYCNGIRYGNEGDWDFLWRHYQLTSASTEKALVLRALGCTRQIWILSSYMEKILDESKGVRKQDGVSVFTAVDNNKVGTLLAWNFLRGNYLQIESLYGQSIGSHSRMIKSVTEDFNTEFQLQEVKMFQEKFKDHLTSATRATQQSIEKVQNNVIWMKKNYDSIVEWLKQANNRQSKSM